MHNIAVRGCHHFRFFRVASFNAVGDGINLREPSRAPWQSPCVFPHHVKLEECRTWSCGRMGLTIGGGWAIRILGGSYSHNNGFMMPNAGIDLEGPTEVEYATARADERAKHVPVGLWDVLISRVEFLGNWKSIQINPRFNPRLITIEHCTFDGRGRPERCVPEYDGGRGPNPVPDVGNAGANCVGFSPADYAIVCGASYSVIQHNTFSNYFQEGRLIGAEIPDPEAEPDKRFTTLSVTDPDGLHGVVTLFGHARNTDQPEVHAGRPRCVYVIDNRFEDICGTQLVPLYIMWNMMDAVNKDGGPHVVARNEFNRIRMPPAEEVLGGEPPLDCIVNRARSYVKRRRVGSSVQTKVYSVITHDNFCWRFIPTPPRVCNLPWPMRWMCGDDALSPEEFEALDNDFGLWCGMPKR